MLNKIGGNKQFLRSYIIRMDNYLMNTLRPNKCRNNSQLSNT